MPVPAHQRVTVYGTLTQEVGAGTDIFDFGWAVVTGMGDEALATTIAGMFPHAVANEVLNWYTTATFQGVRAETIDASGKVTSSYNAAGTPTVGNDSAGVPTFCCSAITLETGAVDAKGRKVRGRFYPPAMAGTPIGSAIQASNVTTYAQNWATFLGAIVAATSPMAVASSTSAGLTPVTGISVDNIVDSIRHRKNRVISQRSAVQAI